LSLAPDAAVCLRSVVLNAGRTENDGFSGLPTSLADRVRRFRPILMVKIDPRVRVMPRSGALPDVSTHQRAPLAPIL
jgi:hypothetical protein